MDRNQVVYHLKQLLRWQSLLILGLILVILVLLGSVLYQQRQLSVLRAQLEVQQVQLDEVETDESATATAYQVVAGDSWWLIAQRQLGDGDRYLELQQLNQTTEDRLDVGQIIRLPSSNSSDLETTSSRSQLDYRSEIVAEEPLLHSVREGESLWLIAQQYSGEGENWPQLYTLNRDLIGSNPDLIRIESQLLLPDNWQVVHSVQSSE